MKLMRNITSKLISSFNLYDINYKKIIELRFLSQFFRREVFIPSRILSYVYGLSLFFFRNSDSSKPEKWSKWSPKPSLKQVIFIIILYIRFFDILYFFIFL